MDHSLKINRDEFNKIPVILPDFVYAIVASYLSELDSSYCRQFSGNVLTRDCRIINENKGVGIYTIFESSSNGVLHSFDDEPSEIICELYGNTIRYQYNWYHFGKLHRNFGLPARINLNSNMDVEVMFWYENGKQAYDKKDAYPNYIIVRGDISVIGDTKRCVIGFSDEGKSYYGEIVYHNPKKLSSCMIRQDIFRDAKECYMTTDKSPDLLKNFYYCI